MLIIKFIISQQNCTAGVYLLIRSSPLIEYSSVVLLLTLWLGAITTVFSSLVGLFQQDIKKVIAYSTMSQLGMMVIAIGLSSYNLALFHLVNHAFYKGLLFLGAGAVIHAVGDNQDFRKYGGLFIYLPLTYSVMLIASLSLVAFPFMTGFYSKDFILESAFGQYYFSSIAVYVIAVIGAIFTTLYSVKVLYLTFLAYPNGPRVNYYTDKIYESKFICNMLLEYIKKIGILARSVKIGMPVDYRYDIQDKLSDKIKGINYLNSFLAIPPYKLQSVFNEIQTILWKSWVVLNLSKGYSDKAFVNNYITDYAKIIKIAINEYSKGPNIGRAHEGDIFLSLPLVILAIFSVFFGYLTKDIFIGLGSSFFIDNSIFIHPVHEIMLDTEFAVPVLFKLLPLVFTILLSVLAIILSEFLPESLINFKFSKFGYNIFGFFNQRFLVEMFYNKYVTNLVLNLGGQTTKVLDKGSIELIGPFGLELGFIKLSKNIASLSTGIVTSYALYILMGFVIYLLITYLTLLNFDIVLIFILTLISWGVVYFYFNLNNNILESKFFFSLYFFYYKLKDIYVCNRDYLLLAYLFIIFMNLLNQLINPELPNLYIIEDNNTSGSSNVDKSSNVDNSSNTVEPRSYKYEYKGLADSIHKEIAEIDKKLNELKPDSADYEKEKEALLDVRESLTDHMTLLNEYKSTRSGDSYIPQSSDNKRMGDSSSSAASSSKRSRD